MKILQVTEFFTPSTGGSAQVVYQVSRHLARRGHPVTVCTSNFGQSEAQFPDVSFPIARFSSLPTRWKFYVTPGLIPWVRKHLAEFDIVHMHNVRTFQNAVIASEARKIGIPYVLSAHGSLPHLIGHHAVKRVCDVLFVRRLLRDASRLIAVSEAEISQYRQAGIPNEKIAIIPNGLDLDEFSALPERGTFRQKFQIPSQAKMVLFLGRLHKRKGVDHLIEAFALLKTRVVEAVLVVAGPDDGELSALQVLVTRFGLNEHVIFTGPLFGRDKLTAYRDADVLASPGIHEIFGLVPFEALMCGTPVIVTDDCGAGSLIQEAEAGYLISYGNIEALASILLRVLDNPIESNLMVMRGQEYVRRNLNWQATSAKLEEVYFAIASKNGAV